MSITSKLSSALRGTVREAAEGVIDANSIKILGQEIHDFENDIAESKQKLALIITQAMQVERQISQTKNAVSDKEQEVTTLVETGNEDGAIAVAEEIAQLEAKLKQIETHQKTLRTHEQTLKASLKTMVSHLDTYKSEYNMAKANENMYKAQSKLSQTDSKANNRFANIQSSLNKIQERQQETADNMDVFEQIEEEFSTTPTNQYRKVSSSAQDILDRIKSRSNKTPTI